jgi:hypothetical protein
VLPRGIVPWARDGRGWCVWGIPVDPQWWASEYGKNADRRKELEILAAYRDDLDGGPGCLAGLVASATEQVACWEDAHILVRGRSWADLGGGSGHYALALHLAGAAKVTLVDEFSPDAWSLPVLWAAGIDVVVGDAVSTPVADADAALLLYVHANTLRVLMAHPSLRLVITDDLTASDRKLLTDAGWKVSTVRTANGAMFMGDGYAVPGLDHSADLDSLWVCQGESQLVLPEFDEEFEGEVTFPGTFVPSADPDDDDNIPF